MRRLLVLLPLAIVACAHPGADAPAGDAATKDTASGEAMSTDVLPRSDAEADATAGDTGVGSCGGPCGELSFCFKRFGDCSGNGGICALRPTECPKDERPVCGCDGRTYGNVCLAMAAGMNVATSGACATSIPCGGVACAPTQYCDHAAPGTCAGDGTCKPRPESCPPLYDPVCGCNGVRYSSPCVASSHGVDYASKGACP